MRVGKDLSLPLLLEDRTQDLLFRAAKYSLSCQLPTPWLYIACGPIANAVLDTYESYKEKEQQMKTFVSLAVIIAVLFISGCETTTNRKYKKRYRPTVDTCDHCY
jgi:hypothetical protein